MRIQKPFWNGPAFMAGRSIPTSSFWPSPSLGQAPSPGEFQSEFETYKAAIAGLPEQAQAQMASTVNACEIFLQPENFVPMRARGCLNSLLAQIRAAGGKI